ncbi:hypothetical protein AeMF1_012788 [Aphanomyces euteiches]|nr:hypothetical protein AeMF1_012788 [Aphanomyces euteiches]KAH9186731.1 hypothetical protein AeNC1_011295 [Aphanomyces euteiches]
MPMRLFVKRTEAIRVLAVAPAMENPSSHRVSQHDNSAKRVKALVRIVMNLVTFNAVASISLLIVILALVGFFHRRMVLGDIATDSKLLQGYGQTCRIDINGFIPGSCTSIEIATTTFSAWTAIGQALALQWVATSTSPYFVATCIKTKPTNSKQTALIFLAGYDYFPNCQPSNGPQEIAGLAMLETTVRDEFLDGAYMLTVFADKTMSETLTHVNSDGSTDRLVANINQTLIAINGSASIDAIGVNSVQYFVPLANHFKVSTYSYPVVLDITDQVNPTMLAGWNFGRKSKKAVMMTWDYGHEVSNRHELVSLQLLFLGLGSILVSGDFYLTVQGLKGFLARKPIMTFDLASGFERRKFVLFIWTCSIQLVMVFPDIVCIYDGSTGLVWFFVILVLGALYNCVFFLVLGIVSGIPSPFNHVITISSSTMNNFLFVLLEIFHMWQLPSMLAHYRNAPTKLGLNIYGEVRSSGAYDTEKMTSAVTVVLPTSGLIILGCILFSIAVSTFQLKRRHGTYLMSVEWTRSNSFLNHCGMPNWISGLPLVESEIIKIGNKLYCKPSTQATLGFATIVPHESQSDSSDSSKRSSNRHVETMSFVSVYSLLPVVLSIHRWLPKILCPTIFGTVTKNQFTPGQAGHLEKQQYVHHLGTCAN